MTQKFNKEIVILIAVLCSPTTLARTNTDYEAGLHPKVPLNPIKWAAIPDIFPTDLPRFSKSAALILKSSGMSHWKTSVLLMFLLTLSKGQDGQVCHHLKDITKLWLIQCFGLNSTNAGQLPLVLKDATRILPNKRMLVEISDSDGAAIPEAVFDGYWIETLVMKNCNFTSLPFHVITNLSTQLLDLDLGHNEIVNVDFQRFNEMPFASKLLHLALNNNQIGSLPESALVNFTMLHTLDLSENLLAELVNNTFRGMEKLRNLHLINNQLASIGKNSFADLQSLHLLILDHNKINFLEEGTFSQQNQSSLNEIPLEGNPFYCNCTLQWLKDYLTSINYLDLSGATCVAPHFGKFEVVDFCAAELPNENELEEGMDLL